MRRLSSMRARVTLACLLILAPFLLLTSHLIVTTMFHVENRDDQDKLQKVAAVAAAVVREKSNWQEELLRLLRKADAENHGMAILVADPTEQNRVIWRSQAAPPWSLDSTDNWLAAQSKAPPHYLIQVTLPNLNSPTRQWHQSVVLRILSVVILVVVGLGAWLVVGRTLLPIRLLARQASAASVENLRVRLNAPSRDAEMVELVETLNDFIGRLAGTAEAKGRFYAAASHELRTPLQALSGHLEVALSRPRTAAEYEKALAEAHRQTGRLTSLTRDLLLLHQLDTAAEPGPREPIDLTEICGRILNNLQPLIEARHLTVQPSLPCHCQIQAVPTYAEILIRNLLDNAVRYAREGGTVRVMLTAREEGTLLEVFNDCPALPIWDTGKLFEPFYRPDAARSRKTGGNGLGLAICRAIAAASDWTVTARQTPQGVEAAALFCSERTPPAALR